MEIVDSWFQYDQVRPISPGANFWAFFRQVVVEGQVVGPLMSDAKLAALALECGAMVSTNDLDFLRFQAVQVEFPLRQR